MVREGRDLLMLIFTVRVKASWFLLFVKGCIAGEGREFTSMAGREGREARQGAFSFLMTLRRSKRITGIRRSLNKVSPQSRIHHLPLQKSKSFAKNTKSWLQRRAEASTKTCRSFARWGVRAVRVVNAQV